MAETKNHDGAAGDPDRSTPGTPDRVPASYVLTPDGAPAPIRVFGLDPRKPGHAADYAAHLEAQRAHTAELNATAPEPKIPTDSFGWAELTDYNKAQSPLPTVERSTGARSGRMGKLLAKLRGRRSRK